MRTAMVLPDLDCYEESGTYRRPAGLRGDQPAVRAYTTLPTPLGELLLVGDGQALQGLYLPEHRRGPAVAPHWRKDTAAFCSVSEQLAAYFAGELRVFDVPVLTQGTPFQRRVWDLLGGLPYGGVSSYGSLAAGLGAPGAARAVGAAVARNPISVIVPCHRVIGGQGGLTGYAGGMARKRWLLAHERAVAAAPAG